MRKKFNIWDGDILTVTIAGLALTALWWFLAGFYWGLFWLGVLAWLGFVEWVSWSRTGFTLSQKVAGLLKVSPLKAWLLIASLVAIVGWLIAHFIAIAR